MDYFSLFGLPITFQIDSAKLADTYKSLAQVTHPDKFSGAGERQKLLAVQKNAQVNDAYQTLKSPLSRAEHMLEIRGLSLSHETKTVQEPEFLMQQMEWREQLEEVEHSTSAQDQLEQLDKDIANHQQQHFAQLENYLQVDDDASNEQAAVEIRKLKFLAKMRKEIELKEDVLFADE